jgi:hypothetical protein
MVEEGGLCVCVCPFVGISPGYSFCVMSLIALVFACYFKKIPISQHIAEALFLRSSLETALARIITRRTVRRVG